MKLIIAVALAAAICSCKASYELVETEKPNLVGLKSHQIRGTIFKRSYSFSPGLFLNVDSAKRFTPTKDDIAKAEKVLRSQIKRLNKGQPNQLGNCPVIHKNLANYFRQYVGYHSEGGRIVHINLLWNRYSIKDRLIGNADPRMSFDEEYTVSFDGCSRYWQIDVNLTTNQALNLEVNGIG